MLLLSCPVLDCTVCYVAVGLCAICSICLHCCIMYNGYSIVGVASGTEEARSGRQCSK